MANAKTTLVLLAAVTMLAVQASVAAAAAPSSNLVGPGGQSAPPAEQVLGSPPGVPFQGFLTDAAGHPLGVPAPVVVNVTFRIWDAAAAGNLLHTETDAVTVSEGVFQANLSPPADVFNATPRFLGLSVNGGAELTPRTQILSTPYARVSQTMSGFGEVDGQLQEGGGFTEIVNSTSDQTMRRYYLTGATGSDWSNRDGRVIIVMGGQSWPGLGTVTVQRNGVTIDTFSEPGAGTRPWTYIAELPSLTNSESIDVLARAQVAGSPAAIRSITLETASVEVPGPPIVAFQAYNSASDAAVNGWNLVQGDVEVFDTGSNYNPATSRFTAPTNGIYDFTQKVVVNNVADGIRVVAALWVNGSIYTYTDTGYTNTNQNWQSWGASATISLNAGDYVESQVYYGTTGGQIYGSGTTYTYFMGHQITSTTTPVTRPAPQVAPDDPARP